MKYLDEYRDAEWARALARRIHERVRRPWRIMEICGGQTHAILRFGLDRILPEEITLLHGPGCPVCVTPAETVDQAVALAARPEVILCSYGDMLRVPGTQDSLMAAKSRGGDVRIVYSPLDALETARRNPGREVVFFAVGFETTAPANGMSVFLAKQQKVPNFSVLASHVRVPPAMEVILSSPANTVQGFLAAGHVCTVMGITEYEPLCQRYGVPIVVTGFEPVDILQGISMCVDQLERGDARVENQYRRSVTRAGNIRAQNLIREVFVPSDRRWRGIGAIPRSGLALAPAYAEYDAEKRFSLKPHSAGEASLCLAGEIMLGARKPSECPAFAGDCTPEHPLGAAMVSSEGACAAYYRYRRPRALEVSS